MSAKNRPGSHDGGHNSSHTRIALAAITATLQLDQASRTTCEGCEALALRRAATSFAEVQREIEERISRCTLTHGSPPPDEAEEAEVAH